MSDPVAPGASQPEPRLDDAAGAAAQDAASPPPGPGAGPDGAERRPRHPFYLRGRRLRLPSTRRGLFALLLVLGAVGGVAAYTGVSLIEWTETPDFCGRCHTMAPELQAFEAGPHRGITCGDCHVEPGIMGWVKAKVNGTRQLIDTVLDSYPTPILPPDHDELPSTADSCERCHSDTRTAVSSLVNQTVYGEDRANTPQYMALLLRPAGGDPFAVKRSVHWHVVDTIDYWSPDPRAQTIDYVRVSKDDGRQREYISLSRVKVREDARPDIDALRASELGKTVSCLDCHNRVGHDIANPRTKLDQAITEGAIDRSLPYIKREGMEILWSGYPDTATADAAADRIRDFYALNFPDVAASRSPQIGAAIDQIKAVYRLTNTPDMKVTPSTYANNLGHLDFPGCFRCHDGGHFEVVDGALTGTVIPSTCETCHTFPQIGPAVASLPLGAPPETHSDDLWVFNHKGVATSVDPGGQSCGECHARDYCVNCHSTGAVTVDHDLMNTNHAAVIRAQGNTACAYCHQPVFCATCHGSDRVLPLTTPFSTRPQSQQGAEPSASPPGQPGASPGPSSQGALIPSRVAPAPPGTAGGLLLPLGGPAGSPGG